MSTGDWPQRETVPYPASVPGSGGPAVPGYEILEELGRGGMGVVYLARHLALDRLVALKMILAGAHAGPQELARFRTEAKALARLKHPNIVEIYEVGEQNGLLSLSLEYIPGTSLARWLAGRRLPPAEAARLVETLARAVHHAHQQGVVHRDLNPANILLSFSRDPKGRGGPSPALPFGSRLNEAVPKITDFGLARFLDRDGGLTGSGAILGTPSFMAPEQAAGKVSLMGPACDIWALGAILYDLLVGRPPFKGETALETLEQVRRAEPVPPRRLQADLPPQLEAICLRCLRKDPAQRYGSALELAEELARFLEAPVPAVPQTTEAPPQRSRAWLWAALAAVLALAVGGVWYALTSGEGRPAAVQQRARKDRPLDPPKPPAPGKQGKPLGPKQQPEVKRPADPPKLALPRGRFAGLRERKQWRELKRTVHGPLAFSPDAKLLAVGLSLGKVRLRDPRSGAPVGRVLDGRGAPRCLAFSADGKVLAVAGPGPTLVTLWDLPAGKLPRWKKGRQGQAQTTGIKQVLFAPAGNLLATLTEDLIKKDRAGIVTLLHAADGRPTAELPTRQLRAMAFTRDGSAFVTGGPDGAVEIRSPVAPGKVLARFTLGGPVQCFGLSPDGATLAAGSAPQGRAGERAEVTLWDLARDRAKATYPVPPQIWALTFTRDGKRLVVLSGQTVHVLDPQSGRAHKVIPLADHYLPKTFTVLPDGRTLAVVSWPRAAFVDLESGEERAVLSRVSYAALSPDGGALAAYRDGHVRVWDVVWEDRKGNAGAK